MRLFVSLAGVLLATAIAMVACGSSDDGPGATAPEAGTDAPNDPRDGGRDAATTGSVQRSGTRLKLMGNESGEGAFFGAVLFDTKLGEVCYAVRSSDGSLRCIPARTADVPYFSDDQCTRALAAGSGDCANVKFGSKYVVGSTPCDFTEPLFRLGPKIATPAMVYAKNGATCVATTPAADGTYYPVLSTVAPSELVGLAMSEVALTPSLRAIVYDGDDGSRFQRADFIDVARGKACTVNLGGDGKTRCTPKGINQTGDGYSDPSCTSRAAIPAECTLPYEVFDDSTAVTFELGSGQCQLNTSRAFELGAKRATRDNYSKDADGGCAGPTPSPRDVFDVGPELAPATLPEITVGTGGGPRIVEKTYASGAVTVFHTGQLTDTTLGIRCAFRASPDGKYRCFPQGIGASYFSDDQCKTPLGVTADTCELATAKYIVVEKGAGCAEAPHVFLIGTRLDPATTTAYLPISGTCTALPPSSSNALAYFTLGAEVMASTFAEGKSVTK